HTRSKRDWSSDVCSSDLQFFNPSYKLDMIPFVDDENYVLRLPVADIGRFVANEDTIYARVNKELEKREKTLPELVQSSDQIRYRSEERRVGKEDRYRCER